MVGPLRPVTTVLTARNNLRVRRASGDDEFKALEDSLREDRELLGKNWQKSSY